MMTIFCIGIIIVILMIAGFTYIVLEKNLDGKMNIKQDKCSNFTETPKLYYYYLIEWRSIYAKTFPYYNRIIVDGDVSKVRKQIKKLRKKYKESLNYKVYEQRDLTNFINWE